MWSENVAGRGGQEVGSCIMKHLTENIPETTETAILYSDSCGGQNRNIKLTLLLKKLLSSHPTLKIIKQKYFVSGHSYNSCDRAFATIECARKTATNLYTPDQWMELVKGARKTEPKFMVTKMTSAEFFSSFKFEQIITNRKMDINKKKINWFEFRTIEYSQDKPFMLTVNNCIEINISKKSLQESAHTIFTSTPLECSFPNGKPIDNKKFKDLVDLLKFVPKEHHQFFLDLKNNLDEVDYGLASDDDDDIGQ